jgi:3-deoxy-D-manno-octulosonic-acid transferase
LYLITPLVPLRLIWRGLRAPAYLRRWPERFGWFKAPDLKDAIWVHAVSVGEVHAAEPVVRRLRERHPDRDIAITTTTPTGSIRVRELFGDSVFHVYAPYDLPGAVKRFLDRVRPKLAVIMETEIWPNLFHSCGQRDIPVVMANARMSARSARSYGRFSKLVAATLQQCTAIAAQGTADRERLVELGARSERVVVTGSVKFDITAAASLREQADGLRRVWGVDRAVWIAGSTHEPEEQQVLEAFESVRRVLPDALLILAPRHPERGDRVAALVRRQGLRLTRRSESEMGSGDADCFLVDTLGELPLFYAAADLAFVGGSLSRTGGHNVLEPAVLGVPVLIGPNCFNFLEITELLRDEGALLVVEDQQALAEAATRLLRDGDARDRMGTAAAAVIERNRGSVERLLDVIETAI